MGLKRDLERVTQQERELQFERLDARTVWDLGTRLRAMAEERSLPVVIDVRRFGQPLFYTALEGTTPDNAEWVRRKANVVARLHRSSYGVLLDMKMRNETLLHECALPVADFVEAGGSFPLTVAGVGVVGSVTISGLADRDDHELAVEALCVAVGHDYAALRLGAEENLP
jgi:uncharacterized protein (UPF0303 family)